MQERSIATGIYWHDEKPLFYVMDENGVEVGHAMPAGSVVSIKSSGQRYCTGYYDLDKKQRVGCPAHESISNGGSSQCSLCMQDDKSFAIKTGLAHNDSSKALLSGSHYVYLALFGEIMPPKVGVARAERLSDRIHEQGAWGALAIKETDGLTAREIERTLSRNYHLPETMSSEKKLAQLCNQLTNNEMRSRLLHSADMLKDDLMVDSIDQDAHFIFSYTNFGIDIKSITNPLQLITSFEDEICIQGKIIGVFGKIALILSNGHTYALHSKNIEGFEIQVEIGSSTKNEELVKGGYSKKNKFGSTEQAFLRCSI